MQTPNQGRPEGWPTNEQLAAQLAPGRDGPFPRKYQVVFLYEQPDGTYQEQLRTYEITHKWEPPLAEINDVVLTATDHGVTWEEKPRYKPGPIPFEYTHEVGRIYRVAQEGEASDLSVLLPHDFSTVRLVQIN